MQKLTDCRSFKHLKELPVPTINVRNHGTTDRDISHASLTFSYAMTPLSDPVVSLLQELSQEQNVIEEYLNIKRGLRKNIIDNSSIRLFESRDPKTSIYAQTFDQINAISSKMKRQKFRHIVQIGIGGSHIGPLALFKTLEPFKKNDINVHFLSSTCDFQRQDILSKIDLKDTLFIVASKSGDTLETKENLTFIIQEFTRCGYDTARIKDHMVSITCQGTPMDIPDMFSHSFYISPDIGGRFSSLTSVGLLLLSLVSDKATCEQLLAGAYDSDCAAENMVCHENAPLMHALLQIYYRNVMGCSSKAIVPYVSVLSSFITHLQQLECESNGKSLTIEGEHLDYATAPVVFGQSGSECQHSFFQMLHQGSHAVPVEFIDLATNSYSQKANMMAQEVALAQGSKGSKIVDFCPGNRPSTRLTLRTLDPYSVGGLLSFYENSTIFQGLLWHINSFDQEGVRLGKSLALDFIRSEE